MRVSLIWLFCCLLLGSSALEAQTSKMYTVQVGTFHDSKISDFESIRPLGLIYGQRLENNLYRVFLGGFAKAETADKIAAQLRQKGYQNAVSVEIPVDETRTATVVQFATLNAKRAPDWQQYAVFENLFAIIQDDVVKLVTGPYATADEARQQLDRIKQRGFADAFIKRVPTAQLQRITPFETGLKQPLIPLNLAEAAPAADPTLQTRGAVTSSPAPPAGTTARSPEAVQTAGRGNAFASATETAPAAPPAIRANVKRRSALELQKALKAEGTYPGALDGLYGNGTAAAYQQVLGTNRELQKYSILARSVQLPLSPGANDPLQRAIDELPADPQAPLVLERSNQAIAKAYRAYLRFSQNGRGNEVNALMNSAIKQAYSGKQLNGRAPFDYQATYAYNDIDQLLLHLYYIHLAPGVDYAAPCWLLRRHPKEAAEAMNSALAKSGGKLQLQTCDPFLDWDESRLAVALATDLHGSEQLDNESLSDAAGQRARLFLNAQPLDNRAAEQAAAWNDQLWEGLNGWAASDPLHQRLVNAFRIAYYQTLVRLEDYYMNKGFNAEQAKPLALATVSTMVGPMLERFI